MLYKEINVDFHEIKTNRTNHCFDTCDFLRKEASAESVEYFNNLKPKKNHLYFLVVAMTSGEFFSSNRNGDYFKEEDLKKYYHIFENSGVFWNHDNKDPSKSFGKVLKAFYNDKMHRVELVIEVPTEKSRYLKDYIEQGKPISVSMGLNTPCFPVGTHVMSADGSSKCITSFSVGEEVITSQGNIKKIQKITKTRYDGPLVKITPRVGNYLTPTLAHKFHVIDFRKLGYNKKALRLNEIVDIIRNSGNIDDLKEWVRADELDINRHILTHTTRVNGDAYFSEEITPEMARLLGYYLAEGHIEMSSKRDGSVVKRAGIVLSCHKDDNAIKEIDSIMRKIPVPFLNYYITERDDCNKLRLIYIRSREIAELSYKYCGHMAKEKRLSPEIMNWPDNLKMEFLGAYFDVDGHFSRKNGHEGHLKCSTSSEVLAEQVHAVLDSLGIQASRNRLNHKPSGFAKNNTISYEVVMGAHSAQNFFGYCSKVSRIKLNGKSSSRKKFIDNHGLILIKNIELIHTSDIPNYDGYVYDLVIEDDHSFIAEKINVHNSETCSICGHVTRGSYANRCEHLKFMMNTVLHDGRKVYAICGTPYRLFDISFVFKPADRTAYAMLTKSASESPKNGGLSKIK